MPNFLSKPLLKNIAWLVLIATGTLLSFTILAQANDHDYYLQCTQANSCDLVINQSGTPITITHYTTEPVVSCIGTELPNHTDLERDCELRLSIAQPD